MIILDYIYIQFYDISNLMPNFIIKNFIADFLSNLKVVELKHEFEPGDLGDSHDISISEKIS